MIMDIEFGILQKTKSDLRQTNKFSEEIKLTCSDTYLLDLVDFLLKDSSTPVQCLISDSYWIRLNEMCEARSTLQPTIGSSPSKSTSHLRSQLSG